MVHICVGGVKNWVCLYLVCFYLMLRFLVGIWGCKICFDCYLCRISQVCGVLSADPGVRGWFPACLWKFVM